MPIFDFSTSKPIPAYLLSYSDNEDDNETDYAGSGDENDQNVISSFIDEEICYLCKNIIEDGNILDVDTNDIEDD